MSSHKIICANRRKIKQNKKKIPFSCIVSWLLPPFYMTNFPPFWMLLMNNNIRWVQWGRNVRWNDVRYGSFYILLLLLLSYLSSISTVNVQSEIVKVSEWVFLVEFFVKRNLFFGFIKKFFFCYARCIYFMLQICQKMLYTCINNSSQPKQRSFCLQRKYFGSMSKSW